MSLTKTEQNFGVIISFFTTVLLALYIIFSAFGFEEEMLLLVAFGIVFVALLCLFILVPRSFRKANKLQEIDYLNIGTQRYLLGLFMIFYGLPKLFGTFFDYQLFALDTKLKDVSEFELAWYYFGKNKWQELFAGLMEFIPGILLFSRRRYYIAAIILLPVTAQVFILNLFFKIGGVTFPAATILLACNIYILYSQKEKIIQFFKSLNFSPDVQLGGKTQSLIKICKWTFILLVAFLIFNNLKPLFFKADRKIKYEKLIGMYTLEKMTKNNIAYIPANDSILYKDLYIEKQDRWNLLRRFNNETSAFIFEINTKNDSVKIYINKGGIGDNPNIIDSLTVLKGTYKLENDLLKINGIQLKDTLQLNYKKQNISPKKWFW